LKRKAIRRGGSPFVLQQQTAEETCPADRPKRPGLQSAPTPAAFPTTGRNDSNSGPKV
jgi:hypothetical protein